ncbi:hypothetical protein CsatB_022643 [Cannabis sativa]
MKRRMSGPSHTMVLMSWLRWVLMRHRLKKTPKTFNFSLTKLKESQNMLNLLLFS